MAIDWAKEYQPFTDDWNNKRNNIVHAERSNEVLTSSDPYILWFRRHTLLVLSDPSDIALFIYQGIGGSLEGLAHRRDRLDFRHFGEDPSMAVDITATSVLHMNMPSSEPSVPPLHPTPCHAHQSDPFDMEHFGDGPSMGLPCHGPSTAMPTPHFDPIECTQYISQSSPDRDPLMSEHTSAYHGHILEPSWSPPPYRTEVGSPVTSLAPLSTACLSNMMPSSSTLTTRDHLIVHSSLTPPQANVDETMAPSSPMLHLTLSELHDPLITHDFHIEGDGEGQVHAPTRGTGRGRGRGSRRGQGRGVSRGRGRAIDHDSSAVDAEVSQISAVCEGLPAVVSNICTATIGDRQPPSEEASEGVVRATPLDIQRVYSKRPRRQTHGRGCGAGGKLAH
ncbi:hypothetical protein CsSME_00051566 [Camellia sinensis var. sinensis]